MQLKAVDLGGLGVPVAQGGRLDGVLGPVAPVLGIPKTSFLGGSRGKASACNSGDPGSIPGLEDLLEKEMATQSSTLAWRIPWSRSLVGYIRSMGLQRVGHD